MKIVMVFHSRLSLLISGFFENDFCILEKSRISMNSIYPKGIIIFVNFIF